MDKLKEFNDTYMAIVNKGHTPYVLVTVNDPKTVVPMHLVKDGKIVLSISMGATKDLFITEAGLTFSGRFTNKHYNVFVPMCDIAALYSKEDKEGVMFQVPKGVSFTPLVDRSVTPEAKAEDKPVKANPFRVVK